MPPVVFDVLSVLGALLRLIGLVVLGIAFSFFALEVFRKGLQVWMVQVAVFLGFAGLVIALAVYTSAGGLGAFTLGAGIGMLMRLGGLGVKKDEEKKE